MYLCTMMFTCIICKDFCPWVPSYLKILSLFLVCYPEVVHSHCVHALLFYCVVCNENSSSVVAVDCRISLIMRPSCALRNNAPNSASAADAATNYKTEHKICITPFNCIGLPLFVFHPMKKCPEALPYVFCSEMYDESEWMLSTMSNA